MGWFRIFLCALLPSWASPQQASCPYIDVEGHPHQFGMLPRSSPTRWRGSDRSQFGLCSQGGWLKRMPASAQTSRATTASSCSTPVRPSDSVTAQRTNDSHAAAARWMVFGSESAFGAAPRFCCFKRPDSSWQPCGSELQSWTPVTEGGARLVCYLLAARWRYAQSPPRSCSLCDLRHPDPVRLRGDVLCSGASFSHICTGSARTETENRPHQTSDRCCVASGK